MYVLKHTFRFAALAAAIAAPSAFAQTAPAITLYGGGATFAGEAYTGSSFLKTLGNPRRLSQTKGMLPPSVLSDPMEDPGPQIFNPTDGSPAAESEKASLFGAFALQNPTIGVSYCQTGSGRGKTGFNGAHPVTNACKDYGSTQDGYSVPGAAPQDPDFGGTDSPLNQAELNVFNTNKSATRGAPIQIPSVAGSIAITYNNPSLGKKKLNLTRSDVCGIFSGTITNWDQLTHTPKVSIASKPIIVVYRSDNSGTTFSFLNFLSAACPSLGLPGDVATTANRFRMVDSFASGAAPLPGTSYGVSPTAPTPPAGSASGNYGAPGNGAIVTEVAKIDGAIGYVDVANSTARAKLAGGSITFATVSYAADLLKTVLLIPPGESDVCPPGTVGKQKLETGGLGTGVVQPISTVVNPSPTKTLKFTCPAVTYNKLDPAKNLLPKKSDANPNPSSIAVTTDAGKVLSTVSATTGRVSLVNADPASLSPTLGSCLLVVDPADYAQPLTAQTKKAATDFDRYPIIAVTYLLGYTNGYGPKAPAAELLLKAAFDPLVLAKTKTVGKTSGYQPISFTNAASTTPVYIANSAPAVVDACVIN
ncbi:MAG: substrate-binding domain-containing protein [Panacagrimonas sp.]